MGTHNCFLISASPKPMKGLIPMSRENKAFQEGMVFNYFVGVIKEHRFKLGLCDADKLILLHAGVGNKKATQGNNLLKCR